MVLVKDIYLTAEEVVTLKDKNFTICKGARYEMLQTPDGKESEKLIVPIKLANGDERKYVPNGKSRTKLVTKFGSDSDKWIGMKAEFELITQNVFGTTKPVIYVK